MQAHITRAPERGLAVAVGQTDPDQDATELTPLLSLQLAPGWRAAPHDADHEHQVYQDRAGTARLTVAYAGAWARREPPTERQLIDLARACGMGFEDSRTLTTDRGACLMGRFGTATFSSPAAPFAQAWYLTDGQTTLRAVATTSVIPSVEDVTAMQQMVRSLLAHWVGRAARLAA